PQSVLARRLPYAVLHPPLPGAVRGGVRPLGAPSSGAQSPGRAARSREPGHPLYGPGNPGVLPALHRDGGRRAGPAGPEFTGERLLLVPDAQAGAPTGEPAAHRAPHGATGRAAPADGRSGSCVGEGRMMTWRTPGDYAGGTCHMMWRIIQRPS